MATDIPRRRVTAPDAGVLAIGVLSFFGVFMVADLLIGPLFPGAPVFDGEAHHSLSMGAMVGWSSLENSTAWSAWDEGIPSPWPLVLIHMVIDVVFITSYGSLLMLAARASARTHRVVGRALTFAIPLAILVAEALEMWLLSLAALSLQAAEGGVPFPLWLATTIGVFEPVKSTLFLAAWGSVALSAAVARWCR